MAELFSNSVTSLVLLTIVGVMVALALGMLLTLGDHPSGDEPDRRREV